MFISLQSVYLFLCSVARSFNGWFIVFHAALCVLQLEIIIYAFLAVRFYLQTDWAFFSSTFTHTHIHTRPCTAAAAAVKQTKWGFFDSKEISRLDLVCTECWWLVSWILNSENHFLLLLLVFSLYAYRSVRNVFPRFFFALLQRGHTILILYIRSLFFFISVYRYLAPFSTFHKVK